MYTTVTTVVGVKNVQHVVLYTSTDDDSQCDLMGKSYTILYILIDGEFLFLSTLITNAYATFIVTTSYYGSTRGNRTNITINNDNISSYNIVVRFLR